MGIQDVLTYASSPDAGSGQRGSGGAGVRCEGVRDGYADRCSISSKAIAIYEAERVNTLVVARDRIRLGYYLEKGVQDRVVDALIEELRKENVALAAL